MLRLVYNDQFQRDCMMHLGLGQIKANQYKLHQEVKNDIEKLFAGIKQEMHHLRSQISSIASFQGLSLDPSNFPSTDLGLESLFPEQDKSSDCNYVRRRTLVKAAMTGDIIPGDMSQSEFVSKSEVDMAAPVRAAVPESCGSLVNSAFVRAAAPESSSNIATRGWEPLPPRGISAPSGDVKCCSPVWSDGRMEWAGADAQPPAAIRQVALDGQMNQPESREGPRSTEESVDNSSRAAGSLASRTDARPREEHGCAADASSVNGSDIFMISI
jgi:hypothetical protein